MARAASKLLMNTLGDPINVSIPVMVGEPMFSVSSCIFFSL